MQGRANDVDFGRKTITVEESVMDPHHAKAVVEDRREGHSRREVESEKEGLRKQGNTFEVPYDKLVVTVGCYSQTFGTKGVKENAYFMKDVGDARRIRKRLLECFEIANLPSTSEKIRKCISQSRFPNRSLASRQNTQFVSHIWWLKALTDMSFNSEKPCLLQNVQVNSSYASQS